MTKEPKKKKSLTRRILKWTGITFLFLIIIAILIPILFKDQIKQLVIDEVNKSLTATLELDDFDLTFISTFPNMSVQLYGARLKGTKEFEGVTLAEIKQLRADVGFWNVIKGDELEIDAIHVYEPKIDVRVLQNGKANYDIVKPDSIKTPEELEEPSKFVLKLKEYSISDGYIKYDDDASDMFAEIVNLNHEGSGDMDLEVFDFKTKTTTDELTFDMGGLSYLSKVKTDIVVNLLMELKEKSSKFTLKENTFQLNALKFDIDGFYEMLADHDNMDLKLNANKATFKEFLSLIPTFFQSGYESMIAKGSLALNAKVKGKLDDKNMPGWDAGVKISNASIRYPDLATISNIQVDAGSKFPGGSNLDLMTIDVPRFHADFVGNVLDATLKMRNPITNPLLQSTVKAKVDLASLGKVIPLAEGESYSGKLDTDVAIDGRVNDLENENYDAFKAEGTLALRDMNYKSKELSQEVSVNEMIFRFAPQYLALEKLVGKTGKSDFAMDGKVENYLAYLFASEDDKDAELKGNFNLNSNYVDLDELMNIVPASESASPETTETSTELTEPVLVPDNINFDLKTAIAKAKYNGIDIQNIRGDILLKDETATLNNLSMDAMGGNIAVNGSYNTQNHSTPKAKFGYNLNQLDISTLAKNFITV
ncbi:MAG: hypothetical protein ACM31G_11870, partial [Flavobacteriales bacterium]